jgi:hypothetical protein
VDGRIGVQEEAEDLVADGVTGDVGPNLLEDAGVVAAPRTTGNSYSTPIC